MKEPKRPLPYYTVEEIAAKLKRDFEHHGNKDGFYWYVRFREQKQQVENYEMVWAQIAQRIAEGDLL